MAAEIATAIITASSGLVLASASYWFTKRQEREADLRRQKLEHYKDFALSLSGIVFGDATPEGQRTFAKACNNLNLVAPQSVIDALQAFQQEIKVSNHSQSQENHDLLMSRLFYEMRKDIGVTPADDLNSFRVGLWASGAPPKL